MSKILHMPRSRSKSPSRKRARHSADLGDPIVISSDEEEETAHNASHFTLQAADIIKTLRWKMSRLKSVFCLLLQEISYSYTCYLT